MAELVKQRACVVERQQRRPAIAALGKVQYVDDDRRLPLGELVLRPEARHPGARALRGAGKIIADEYADVGSVFAEDLPGPHFRMVARQIVSLFELQTKEAGSAIEGRPDHVVELEIGLQLRLIEIVLCLAHFLRVVAPVPRHDLGIVAAATGFGGQRLAFFAGALNGFAPHRMQEVGDGIRRLRHRVLQAEIGERFEAHEPRILAAQCHGLGDDLAIVGIAGVSAARDPCTERLFAQIAAARVGEEPFNARTSERDHGLALESGVGRGACRHFLSTPSEGPRDRCRCREQAARIARPSGRSA